MMRIVILVASILSTASAVAQDAPALWRDPDGGCTYFRLGDTLSLRYQRDGLPDCPDARETGSPARPLGAAEAATRHDAPDVPPPIAGLRRKL